MNRRGLLSLASLPVVRSTDAAAIEPSEAADFMALALRDVAVEAGDQAYGADVVLNGRIVGQASSLVVARRDPTAHAEREALLAKDGLDANLWGRQTEAIEAPVER